MDSPASFIQRLLAHTCLSSIADDKNQSSYLIKMRAQCGVICSEMLLISLEYLFDVFNEIMHDGVNCSGVMMISCFFSVLLVEVLTPIQLSSRGHC